MTYTFKCETCEHTWEESIPMKDMDVPLSKPCPSCEAEGVIKRIIAFAPRIAYDGAKTVQQRAGSGWNDTLLKIKKGSGRVNTINTK